MDPSTSGHWPGKKPDLIRERVSASRTPASSCSQPAKYARLIGIFDTGEHLAVKVAWLIYQRIIAAYSQPDRRRGKTTMTKFIDPLRHGVPTALEESPSTAAPAPSTPRRAGLL